jgi:hypothetical protein
MARKRRSTWPGIVAAGPDICCRTIEEIQLVTRIYRLFVLVLSIAAGQTAWAYQGGQDILENKADAVLRQWSDKTGKIQSLYTVFNRTIFDPVWQEKDSSAGSARYLAPKMARLDIVGGKRPEHLLLPGNGEAWHFKPAVNAEQENIVEVHKLPNEVKEKDVLEDGPLPFLFATQPEKAKQRYKFEIIEEKPTAYLIRITPKLEEDQKDFVQAEILLDKEKLLPTQIKILEATKQEVTYQIENIWTNIEIKTTDFAVDVPKGWKKIDMAAPAHVGDAGPQPPDRNPPKADRPLINVGQKER